MRQVTVTTPEGKGADVAQIAFSVGIRDVSLKSIRALKSDQSEQRKDHLEVATATHLAKAFVEKHCSIFQNGRVRNHGTSTAIDLLDARHPQSHTASGRAHQRFVSGAVAVFTNHLWLCRSYLHWCGVAGAWNRRLSPVVHDCGTAFHSAVAFDVGNRI